MAANDPRDVLALVQPLFRVTPEPDREPGPHRGGGSGGFYSLIGVFLAVVLLWRWVGVLALALVGLTAAGIYLWTRKK